jgi:hypothetical protein
MVVDKTIAMIKPMPASMHVTKVLLRRRDASWIILIKIIEGVGRIHAGILKIGTSSSQHSRTTISPTTEKR